MTPETFYELTSELLARYSLMVAPIVTAAIALFERYAGVGPKALPRLWQPIPAVVLTTGLLEWLALTHYGTTGWVAAAALIAGLIAGGGSNVTHIGLQAAAKRGKAGKTGLGVLLLAGAALSSAGASGCAILEALPKPSQDEQVAVCATLIDLHPDIREALARLPPDEREAAERAACRFLLLQLESS